MSSEKKYNKIKEVFEIAKIKGKKCTKKIKPVIKDIGHNVWNFLREGSNKKTEESPDIQLKYGIKKKLEKIEKDLFSQHLCYKIIEESYERGLDSKSVKELKLKYPDFFTLPVISWNKEFGYLKNKIFLQNEVIKEFLQNKNYPIDNEFALNANFEHYLRDKAHKKAVEIVDNYVKNGGLN